MGSDAVAKRSAERYGRRHLRQSLGFLCKCAVVVFLPTSLLLYCLDSALFDETFVVDIANQDFFSSSVLQTPVPQRCQEVAHRFHQCQAQPEQSSSLVIGGHRKWCRSTILGGYCLAGVCGIGSRFRYAFVLAQLALDRCIRLELDIPDAALAVVDNAAYRDPVGLWADVVHYRSYAPFVQPWNFSSWWNGNADEWLGKRTYMHITPDGLKLQFGIYEMDPCLFHTILRPSKALQKQIQIHLKDMGPHRVGIHFRTGDKTAFGLGEDERAPSDLKQSLDKLIKCAKERTASLFPDGEASHPITYYLATDSALIKHTIKDDKSGKYADIYIIPDEPTTYRSANDFPAWLEIFLLSQSRAVVANVRRQDYNITGGGDKISTYAKLAAKIGFLYDDLLIECPVG